MHGFSLRFLLGDDRPDCGQAIVGIRHDDRFERRGLGRRHEGSGQPADRGIEEIKPLIGNAGGNLG